MRRCFSLVLFVGAIAAQVRPDAVPEDIQITARQAAQFDALIRVDTRLVEVDVVVRDANGPVAGLTQADFTVYDNGKRVPIAAFSSRTGHVTSNRSALPQGAVSNRLNARGEDPAEATVLLWDVLNTETQDQAWVQSEVLRYLQTNRQDDRIAIYRLVKSLTVLQDFTADPDRLVKAAQAIRPEQSVNLSVYSLTDTAGTIPVQEGVSEELVARLNAAQVTAALEMEWFNTRDRALITLTSLRSIAHHLEGIPGRKKLIWISGSFPAFQQRQNSRLDAVQIESLNMGLQIQKAIEELNHSNVAVYPVDPRGLVTGFASMKQDADYTKDNKGGFTLEGIDTMNLLAGGTGGRAFYGGNGVTSAIREVFGDSELTYTLAFRPSESKPGRTYRRIDVKVARKGVDVRHRRGYYDADLSRQDGLNLTMRNELDATGVGLIGAVEPVAESPGQYRVTLTIDASDLAFTNQQGRWLTLIEYATRFSETPTLSGTTETLLVTLTEERYREVLREGWTVSRVVDTGGPTGRLRIAIQDRTTGNIGSLWVPLGDK